MYVRIKPATNKNQEIPQSINARGVRIVQGGTGVEVKDNGIISRLKKIGGKNIETSKTPFEVELPKGGGVIDLDAMEMKEKATLEEDDKGDEKAPETTEAKGDKKAPEKDAEKK